MNSQSKYTDSTLTSFNQDEGFPAQFSEITRTDRIRYFTETAELISDTYRDLEAEDN